MPLGRRPPELLGGRGQRPAHAGGDGRRSRGRRLSGEQEQMVSSGGERMSERGREVRWRRREMRRRRRGGSGNQSRREERRHVRPTATSAPCQRNHPENQPGA
ncbi:hypothetical protein PVAP13_4KG039358 [Panicum virgatum]|uniref:Uncharacterized protein n=1 Tax=Panicum virgatum TaxID=38727 RepID=A0A8T0TK32_PANVG|nr:hypothetical protein PVAP13_4KG039358 [Panicum virgatum]